MGEKGHKKIFLFSVGGCGPDLDQGGPDNGDGHKVEKEIFFLRKGVGHFEFKIPDPKDKNGQVSKGYKQGQAFGGGCTS